MHQLQPPAKLPGGVGLLPIKTNFFNGPSDGNMGVSEANVDPFPDASFIARYRVALLGHFDCC